VTSYLSSNVNPFTIVESPELSAGSKSQFSGRSWYKWGIVVFLIFLLNGNCFAEHPRQWMDAHIQTELAPFSKITFKQLNATEELLKNMNAPFMRVKINRKKINHYTPSLAPVYQPRVNGFLRLFKRLQRIYDLPKLDFIIVLDDGFDQELLGKDAAPVFCISKLKNQDRILCIPEIHFYPTVDDFYAQVADTGSQFPWEQKSEIAFWRGSTTGGYYTPDDWMNMSRAKLVIFSKSAPEQLNCAFHHFVQGTPETEAIMRSYGLFTEPWNSISQIQHKYLIAINGNTFPSSLKWQLFSGSVVLKNESEWVEWFDNALIPFQHYVPYNLDFSDLLEKIDWLKQNDAIAKEIASNAKKFAKSNLTSKSIEHYVYRLLFYYSKHQIN
jgi:hypothetical protein